MTLTSAIARKLNEIRATELRQAVLYDRLSNILVGPYRDGLASEFAEHAADERKHAGYATRHLVANEAKVDTDVAAVPDWSSLREMLDGLADYEAQGIKKWQELKQMLASDDPFLHVIEDVLSTESHHMDEVKRWKQIEPAGDSNTLDKSVQRWREHIEREGRAGTPPTIWGASPLCPRPLLPQLAKGFMPDLGLSKALLQPVVSTGPGGPEIARKRNASGEFATSEGAKTQSAAVQDKAQQERTEHEQNKKLRLQYMQQVQMMPEPSTPDASTPANAPAFQQGFVKGMPVGTNNMLSATAPSDDQPVMATSSGKPIFGEPHHEGHQDFGPEDHWDAMMMHDRAMTDAHANGDTASAQQSAAKADAHDHMRQESMAPMDRAMGQANGPTSSPTPTGQMTPMTALGQPPAGDPDNPAQMPNGRGGWPGPIPGMINTATRSPIGPQTDPGSMAPPNPNTDRMGNDLDMSNSPSPYAKDAPSTQADTSADDQGLDDQEYGDDSNGDNDEGLDDGSSGDSDSNGPDADDNDLDDGSDYGSDSDNDEDADDGSDVDADSDDDEDNGKPNPFTKSLANWLRKNMRPELMTNEPVIPAPKSVVAASQNNSGPGGAISSIGTDATRAAATQHVASLGNLSPQEHNTLAAQHFAMGNSHIYSGGGDEHHAAAHMAIGHAHNRAGNLQLNNPVAD